MANTKITNHIVDSTVITGQTAVTAADGDYLLVADASDSNALKKVLASDLIQTSEEVADIVGAMVSSNTETGITVTYEDSDNTIDFAVGTLNQNTTGTAATVTGAAQTSITSVGTLTSLAITGDLDIADTGAGAITVGGTTNTYNAPVVLNVSDIGLAISDGTKSLALWGVHGGLSHSGSGIGTRSDHDMFIATNDTKRMVFDTSGNVGIGITTPNESGFGATSNVLSVAGTAQDAFGVLELISTDVTSSNRIGEIRFGNLDAGSSFASNAGMRATRDGADNSSALSLWTTDAGTFAEAMSIDSKQRVKAAKAAMITQVALTSSSAAVAWDSAAAANAYHVTTENTTFSAPSNAVEGAIISVEIAQGGTARTIAWNTVFEFAASTAPTITATANKTDILAFRYNGSVWQEIGRVQNMAQT